MKKILMTAVLFTLLFTACTKAQTKGDAGSFPGNGNSYADKGEQDKTITVDADGQKFKEEYQLVIKPFVQAFRDNNKKAIAQLIQYPLASQYPLKNISNETEMIQRFDEIFDEELINRIKNSSIENDWDDVGWRGIMLKPGFVWLDYDGKMYGTNHRTTVQAELLESALQKDREKLYSSLRNYDTHIVLYLSKTYKIRIDKLKNNGFRLVLWKKEQAQSEKPELILENGIEEVQGAIHNTYFLFTDKEKYYIVYAGNGWEDANITLKILKYPDSSLEGMTAYEILDFYSSPSNKSKYSIREENIKLMYETE
jgi:hypothetical protein